MLMAASSSPKNTVRATEENRMESVKLGEVVISLDEYGHFFYVDEDGNREYVDRKEVASFSSRLTRLIFTGEGDPS